MCELEQRRDADKKRYANRTPEQIAADKADLANYYQLNRDKLIAKAKQRAAENVERTKSNQKKWREKNKEKMADYQRQYRKMKQAEKCRCVLSG